ncbi:MAG: transposase [Opitutaceae bacterium]|jgi:REP element-mobilizing transposase RayT|nr:transposase [Opitutaceae bacterium]
MLNPNVRQAFLPVSASPAPAPPASGETASGTAKNGSPALDFVSTLNFVPPSSVLADVDASKRHLPHWRAENAIYWVTFRMSDSIPAENLRRWKAGRDLWIKTHPEPWTETGWNEYNTQFGERLDSWLDAGAGECSLQREAVRDIFKNCLMCFDGRRLSIHAAVIMPNHVHAIIEPLGGEKLSKLTGGMKGASSRFINKLLARSGNFWMEESYDHIIRSEPQYRHFLRYTMDNPSKARLPESRYWLYVNPNVRQAFLPVSDFPAPAPPTSGGTADETAKNGCPTLYNRDDSIGLPM